MILLALICAINAWSAPCKYALEQEKLCVDFEWKDGPKYDAYSKVKATIYKMDDAKKAAIAPAKPILFYPWMIMPAMEHGGRPVVVQELSPGVFEISKIYFEKMPGTWELRVRYEDNADKKNALVKLPVAIK